MQRHLAGSCVVLLLTVAGIARADEPVFSGPQPGERLVGFEVQGVFDDQAGKRFDLVKQAGGKPIVLVFVHKVTRPSIALVRVVMTYVAERRADGVSGGIVWLDDDATAAEAFLKRARHALPPNTPVGISVDGAEGPGAYGLNRNVTLTVLVGRENKVTANFALVQPSVQADAPKILKAIVDVAGGEVPKLAELEKRSRPMRAAGRSRLPQELQRALRQLIDKSATAEEVDQTAAKIEAAVARDAAARRAIGEIARRIVDSGKLANYGTPPAQEHLRKWARRFGPTKKTKMPDSPKPERG